MADRSANASRGGRNEISVGRDEMLRGLSGQERAARVRRFFQPPADAPRLTRLPVVAPRRGPILGLPSTPLGVCLVPLKAKELSPDRIVDLGHGLFRLHRTRFGTAHLAFGTGDTTSIRLSLIGEWGGRGVATRVARCRPHSAHQLFVMVLRRNVSDKLAFPLTRLQE
jgi:hypothetical protein